MASMKAKQLTQANVIVPAGVHLLDLQIPNDSVIWHLETNQFNHPKSSKRTICSTRTLTGSQCLLTFSQTSEISLYGRGCPRMRQRYHSWQIHSFWFVITSDYWLIHRAHQQLGLYFGVLVFNSSLISRGPYISLIRWTPCISRPGKEHAACEARRKGPRNSPWASVPSWPFLENRGGVLGGLGMPCNTTYRALAKVVRTCTSLILLDPSCISWSAKYITWE